jgi:hypothetical protein
MNFRFYEGVLEEEHWEDIGVMVLPVLYQKRDTEAW